MQRTAPTIVLLTLLPAAHAALAAPPALRPLGHTLRRHASPLAISSEPPQALNMVNELYRTIRRQVYCTLLPFDRGDFRWEFLAPWSNKSLTPVDKLIICTSFIGTAFGLQQLFEPGASVGVHASYIAQFFSYAMADPIGFRSLAVLTSVFEIAGDLFEEKSRGLLVAHMKTTSPWEALLSADPEDVLPILYNLLFGFINGYYILRWFLQREEMAEALEWTPEEETLYRNCFAPLGLRRVHFHRLLRYGTFVSVPTTPAAAPTPANPQPDSAPSGPEIDPAGPQRASAGPEIASAGPEMAPPRPGALSAAGGGGCVAAGGTTLCVQGQPLLDVMVPLNGTVDVCLNGVTVASLPPYRLVGEASLLEYLQSPGGTTHGLARSTVIARPGASFVRFPQRSFYDLMQTEEAEFGTTIQLMISRTLSEKLKEARVSAASFNAAAAAAASVPAAAVTVASTSAVSVAPTSSVSVASAKAAAATAAPLLASGGPVGAPGAGTAPASVAAPPPAVLPSLPDGNSLSTPRPAARALGSRAQTPARSDHRAGPPAVSLWGSGATAGPPAVSPGGSATRLATPCDARVDDLNGEIERLTRQLIVSRQQLADLTALVCAFIALFGLGLVRLLEPVGT